MNPDQIKAKLEQMRRRWPAIAEAADPELVAFFLQRRAPKKRAFVLKVLARKVATVSFLVVLIAYVQFSRGPEPVYVFLVSWLISSLVSLPPSTATSRPFQLFFGQPPETVRDLWLTPLKARNWMAIEAVMACCKPMNWTIRGIGAGLWVIVCPACLWLARDTHLIKLVLGCSSLVLLSGLAVAWLAIVPFIVGSDIYMQAAMSKFAQTLQQTQKEIDLGSFFYGLLKVLLIVPPFILIAIVLVLLAPLWMHLPVAAWGILLWMLAGGAGIFHFKWMPAMTEWQLERQAEAAQENMDSLARAVADH